MPSASIKRIHTADDDLARVPGESYTTFSNVYRNLNEQQTGVNDEITLA